VSDIKTPTVVRVAFVVILGKKMFHVCNFSPSSDAKQNKYACFLISWVQWAFGALVHRCN